MDGPLSLSSASPTSTTGCPKKVTFRMLIQYTNTFSCKRILKDFFHKVSFWIFIFYLFHLSFLPLRCNWLFSKYTLCVPLLNLQGKFIIMGLTTFGNFFCRLISNLHNKDHMSSKLYNIEPIFGLSGLDVF